MHDAETMLKAMEERGVRGNVVVYNTLLRGYARAGNSRVWIQQKAKSKAAPLTHLFLNYSLGMESREAVFLIDNLIGLDHLPCRPLACLEQNINIMELTTLVCEWMFFRARQWQVLFVIRVCSSKIVL